MPTSRRIRSIGTCVAIAVAALTLSGPSEPVLAESGDDGGTATTVPGYDLENDPSVCIGFLPRPNCGREAVDAGDRGGWLQITVFGVLMAGLATIGTVIGRSVRRRDRALAVSARRPE